MTDQHNQPAARPEARPAREPQQVLATMLAELADEFPRFRIVAKSESRLSRLIDGALKVITLGGQSGYMTHYHTVIGYTLYVPAGWEQIPPLDKVITLRHERVHLRQCRRYTLVGLALLYLLPFLPLGLAYGRARLEWEAYQETLRATLELRGEAALRDEGLHHRIVDQFTGPAYGWMWPFRATVQGWVAEAVERLVAEGASSPR